MIPFQVGDKVACVDDTGLVAVPGGQDPVRGAIYTVREVYIATSKKGGKHQPHVLLVELVNPRRAKGSSLNRRGEPGFAARRFRRLQTGKTNIEVFKKMLGPKPKEKVGD